MFGPTDEQWRMLKSAAIVLLFLVFGAGLVIGWVLP
jgi:hypothetical protein